MKNLPTLTPRNIIRVWLGTWGMYVLLNLANFFLPHTGSVTYLFSAIWQVVFWAGMLLTLIVLVLLYQGKGNDSKFNPRWIMYICIGAWATYLLLIGSGRFVNFGSDVFIWSTSIAIQIAALLTLPALAVAFLGLGKQASGQKVQWTINPVLLRVVGTATVAALAVGTYAAVRTIWTPVDAGKFVYNNTANGLGCAALGLTVLLSYLQRDVYWLSRGRTVRLDERQIQERQQVFETSYKLGTALVFAAFCVLLTHKQSLLTVVQQDSMTPGNILWPFANLVVALFALPLLVAAYRTRKPRV